MDDAASSPPQHKASRREANGDQDAAARQQKGYASESKNGCDGHGVCRRILPAVRDLLPGCGVAKEASMMDSLEAFARGRAAQGQPARVFDWTAAARLIRERRPTVAGAGLQDDWEWTGGDIYRDGAPVKPADTYTYLASTWAIPELDMDGDVSECWIWKAETGWDAETYWPAEALAVLNGESP